MDPLSVTASIIGIIAAGAKVVEVLGPLSSSLSGARSRLHAIRTEVSNCMIILSALQTLLIDIHSIASQRRDLIHLDHLITTFSNGVLLFSELETLVIRFKPGEGVTAWRLRFLNHEKDFSSLLERVQWFKTSVSLLLNIIQCESIVDASRHRRALSSAVDKILKNNDDLAQRLIRLEQYLLSGHASGYARSVLTSGAMDDTMVRQNAQPDERGSVLFSTLSSPYFSFEGDLEASRPYRNVTRDTVDFSVRSSFVASHAWSALSDISLSEISAIGVIHLPICSSDIANGHRYDFGSAISVSQSTRQSARQGLMSSAKTSEVSESAIPEAKKEIQLKMESSPPSEPASPVAPVDTNRHESWAWSAHNKFFRSYKIVVLGGSGTGKCDLCIQFLHSGIVDEYSPKVDDHYRKQCVIDEQVVRLDILDTTGQEEYVAWREQNLSIGEGFILVFSILSRSTFEELRAFEKQIRCVKHWEHVPIMVIGNHCTQQVERVVSLEEGQTLAREFKGEYLEVDTEEYLNVDEGFYELVREIRRCNKGISKWQKTRGAHQGETTPLTFPMELPTNRRYLRGRKLWKRARQGANMEQINEDV